MHTNDFSRVGSFFKNDEGIISFVSSAENHIFSQSDFIERSGFYKFDSPIKGAFIESGLTTLDYVFILKSFQFIKIPIFIGNYTFPELLKIDFIKTDSAEKNYFPLSQIAKAYCLTNDNFTPFKTEGRLVITDYSTKMPAKGDIVVFQTVVKNFKTVFPKSIDAWVKLLLKAKEFKTVNKDFLQLKSLFDIK